MKRLTSFVVALAAPLFVALMVTPAQAEEQPAVDIHGFGGWAAGKTNNDNLYPDEPPPIASKNWEYNNYYFTLNLVARPTDKLVIHAQPTWESSIQGRRMQLDLAYVELTVVKDLRLRAGRIKNPLGLYMDVFKVGTLRPFYLLPNAYYRAAPEGYAGIGLNRIQRLGKWELELDLVGGQMDFEPTDIDAPVAVDPVTMMPTQFASVPASLRGRDVVAGGFMVRTPFEGLRAGAAAYSMKLFASLAGGPMMRLADDREKAYSASIEYLNDKISLRSEALLLRGYEKSDAMYVEAAYYLAKHWQVAGTYQTNKIKEPPPVVAQLNHDRTFGVGLNYWVNPKLVWKLDYYRVKDNRGARPADAVNLALAGKLDKDTDVIIGGVHFSF